MTKDATCETDIETEFQDLSDNENRPLITALNNHIKSLEKQLDEKQVVIKTLKKFTKLLLQQHRFLLATINLIKFFLKCRLSLGRKKEISSIDKSIQMHDNNSSNSGINNPEAIRESKGNQSEVLYNSL